MSKRWNWKVGVTLFLAVVIVATSGGLVIGSNLGFKINRSILRSFASGATPARSNRISIPYNHPYTLATQACAALGSTAVAGIQLRKLNPANGIYGTCTGPTAPATAGCCALPFGAAPTAGCCCPVVLLSPNGTCGPDPACVAAALGPHPTCSEVGYTVNCNTAAGGAGDANISCAGNSGFEYQDASSSTVPGAVLVGSSNEAKTWPILRGVFSAGTTPQFDNWVSVPYHATYVNLADVCASIPGCSAPVGSCSVARLDPSNGSFSSTTHNCGDGADPNRLVAVVLGESLRIEIKPSYSNPSVPNQCGTCSISRDPCGGSFPACAAGAGTCGSITQNFCGFLPPHF